MRENEYLRDTIKTLRARIAELEAPPTAEEIGIAVSKILDERGINPIQKIYVNTDDSPHLTMTTAFEAAVKDARVVIQKFMELRK